MKGVHKSQQAFGWNLCGTGGGGKGAGSGAIVPSEETMVVGTTVRLMRNKEAFEAAFAGTGYRWDDTMASICGTYMTIVERPGVGIFGLPECIPDSGQPVWYYPFSVVEGVVSDFPTEENIIVGVWLLPHSLSHSAAMARDMQQASKASKASKASTISVTDVQEYVSKRLSSVSGAFMYRPVSQNLF